MIGAKLHKSIETIRTIVIKKMIWVNCGTSSILIIMDRVVIFEVRSENNSILTILVYMYQY